MILTNLIKESLKIEKNWILLWSLLRDYLHRVLWIQCISKDPWCLSSLVQCFLLLFFWLSEWLNSLHWLLLLTCIYSHWLFILNFSLIFSHFFVLILYIIVILWRLFFLILLNVSHLLYSILLFTLHVYLSLSFVALVDNLSSRCAIVRDSKSIG